ncbi:MAG: cyclic pyranopterin monophosphate synthase MoaC, partial [Chloroflexi bacterium]|nr:cyclic pyranopterin monophosphate synthase MoaC [Chloroflexota bacterium]
MVDVGTKAETARTAVAKGRIRMRPQTLRLIRQNALQKGDVLSVAQIAGIAAAKRTAELIPLAHPLPLTNVQIDFELIDAAPQGAAMVEITATASATAKTGVEMEALTAVSVAALTIYDMCKAVDRAMRI